MLASFTDSSFIAPNSWYNLTLFQFIFKCFFSSIFIYEYYIFLTTTSFHFNFNFSGGFPRNMMEFVLAGTLKPSSFIHLSSTFFTTLSNFFLLNFNLILSLVFWV